MSGDKQSSTVDSPAEAPQRSITLFEVFDILSEDMWFSIMEILDEEACCSLSLTCRQLLELHRNNSWLFCSNLYCRLAINFYAANQLNDSMKQAKKFLPPRFRSIPSSEATIVPNVLFLNPEIATLPENVLLERVSCIVLKDIFLGVKYVPPVFQPLLELLYPQLKVLALCAVSLTDLMLSSLKKFDLEFLCIDMCVFPHDDHPPNEPPYELHAREVHIIHGRDTQCSFSASMTTERLVLYGCSPRNPPENTVCSISVDARQCKSLSHL
jgi:hypothetical protein